ncbi:DUF3618 domain-containing protein [Mangrovicoccus algicola]|uniref:DUF3618 domain-containing protein n=1 Tax=Mangrovicoccus algicola TaxID=2771008 RepID=A0A8J6YYN2_9RHOB|nr:DUF3618 domain-containing protein [Mangrovicoccus algicola]MBE3638421.1 DUF3618 domain-containing protein [Mangrovicoccus algicola]
MAKGLTPEELEREIRAQREALADTLEQLSARLGKGNLWAEAATLASTYGKDAGGLAVKAAKANPGRAAAIGAGAALALWGASRLMSKPEPETRLARFRHRAEDALGIDEKDTESLVKVLKARLEALEFQRDAEERRRAERRRQRLRAARGPLVYGLGVLAIGAAARALRGTDLSKAEARMGDLAEDLAKTMDRATPDDLKEALRPNARH